MAQAWRRRLAWTPASTNITASAGPFQSHDDHGNLTDDGTLGYEWDAMNRLREVNDTTGTVVRYLYDATNRRVMKDFPTTSTYQRIRLRWLAGGVMIKHWPRSRIMFSLIILMMAPACRGVCLMQMKGELHFAIDKNTIMNEVSCKELRQISDALGSVSFDDTESIISIEKYGKGMYWLKSHLKIVSIMFIFNKPYVSTYLRSDFPEHDKMGTFD